jgi:hypothetical protein
MEQKSTQYVLAEKTGDLLAEKNTKIEQQVARIAELEEAIRESDALLIASIPFLPNPGYGWLQKKIDSRVIKNHKLLPEWDWLQS